MSAAFSVGYDLTVNNSVALPAPRLQSAALTDVGRKRENNEDTFTADPVLGLYAVADGMGGHAGGEVASQMAIDLLRRALLEAPDAAFLQFPTVANRRRLLDWLAQTIQKINAAMQARSQEDSALTGMGCTLDVVLIRGAGVFTAHVGDSRIYLLRAGGLYQLTEDHSFGQLLLTTGGLTPEQVAKHPQRNVLTRALGPFPSVQIDTAYFEIDAGDVFLLCSDGLYNEVPDPQLKELLTHGPDKAVPELIQTALDAGGRDNVTAVMIQGHREPAAAARHHRGRDHPPGTCPLLHVCRLHGE